MLQGVVALILRCRNLICHRMKRIETRSITIHMINFEKNITFIIDQSPF